MNCAAKVAALALVGPMKQNRCSNVAANATTATAIATIAASARLPKNKAEI